MAVPDGRRGDDEDGAALFEEEGVEFDDNEDIEHSEIPIHLRPLVSAAESGNLDALRQALGNYYSFEVPNSYTLFVLFSYRILLMESQSMNLGAILIFIKGCAKGECMWFTLS